MVRTRPVLGSATTTLPRVVPRAATAARRTVRSSPSTLSPSVGSTGGDAGGRLTAVFFDGAFRYAIVWVCAPANGAPIIRPAATNGSRRRFICDDLLSKIGKWAVNQ